MCNQQENYNIQIPVEIIIPVRVHRKQRGPGRSDLPPAEPRRTPQRHSAPPADLGNPWGDADPLEIGLRRISGPPW